MAIGIWALVAFIELILASTFEVASLFDDLYV